MIFKGRELYSSDANCSFTYNEAEIPKSDYFVESGVFNVRQSNSEADWTDYLIKSLNKMNDLAEKGIACNFLTKYSNPDFMQPHLYYADPLFFFDYCKKNFSRNVALLHDYDLYDFTIIVRKQGSQQ